MTKTRSGRLEDADSGAEGAAERPDLKARLEDERSRLERLVRAKAGGLLRFEAVEDLVQGVLLRALGAAERVEYRGEAAFSAWLQKIARNHLTDRRKYWLARKRAAGQVLRITAYRTRAGGTRSPGVDPAASGTGASTLASRREDVSLALKAIDLLLPRDQDLIRDVTGEVPIADIARRLGISYDAAEKARHRALERFRKAFELLSRQREA